MKANFVVTCYVNWYIIKSIAASWENWWTYEGISGPDFWGRLNPKWSQCSKGRRQSPIDITPELLLFDPSLHPLRVQGDIASGHLMNTGRGVIFQLDSNSTITFAGGSLSYQYTLKEIVLHYGRQDDRGSEHTIAGRQFPAELQLYAYNSQLFTNWTAAQHGPNGIMCIAILIAQAKDSKIQGNRQLKVITQAFKNITHKGDSQPMNSVSVMELLPTLKHYVTYDGSLTQPACHETVHWIVLNKPLYMSAHQFHLLRNTMLTESGHGDNYRPVQAINHRPLRTSINFNSDENNEMRFGLGVDESNLNKRASCSMERVMLYKANMRLNEDDV